MRNDIKMQVILLEKNYIQKLTLPKIKIGNYSISETGRDGKEKRLITIEGDGKEWKLMSNNYSKIIDPKDMMVTNEGIQIAGGRYRVVDGTILKEYNMYAVKIGDELCIVYCSPVYEENVKQLEIKQFREITIGKDNSNDIQYNNVLVSDKHAKITYLNGRWNIESFDKKIRDICK